MKIELTCAVCGNNRFNLSDAETDSSIVVCEDCGHIVGTFADLKGKVVEEVLRRSGG